MKLILIAGTVISIIAIISFIIGVVLIFIIRQKDKEINDLYSEIENIKNYLVID